MTKQNVLIPIFMLILAIAITVIILIVVPMITNNTPETPKNVCIKTHLSLNKMQSEVVCGTVTEL